jgi:hypothetical protein
MTAAVWIPSSPDEVTATWLSSVLSNGRDPVEIREVDLVSVGTGQTGATYRITPVYSAAPDELPDTFVVKLPTQKDELRAGLAFGYLSEVAFYSRIARRMKVPTPQCFYSDISSDGTEFALLLADLAPAVQGDQIRGCTPRQARLAAVALAGLHGPSWCDPAWLDLTEIAMPKPGDRPAAQGLGEVCRMAGEMVVNQLGPRLSGTDRETITAAMASVTSWLLNAPDRYALVHGDYRLDNILFDGEARITVVDWQTLGIGLPARDLSYFAATGLAPEDRARIEGQLVEDYLEALHHHGVEQYDHETCWQDYRLGMIQAVLTPALGYMFAAASDRGNDMFVTMLERGCRAIRELGTLDMIGKTTE